MRRDDYLIPGNVILQCILNVKLIEFSARHKQQMTAITIMTVGKVGQLKCWLKAITIAVAVEVAVAVAIAVVSPF